MDTLLTVCFATLGICWGNSLGMRNRTQNRELSKDERHVRTYVVEPRHYSCLFAVSLSSRGCITFQRCTNQPAERSTLPTAGLLALLPASVPDRQCSTEYAILGKRHNIRLLAGHRTWQPRKGSPTRLAPLLILCVSTQSSSNVSGIRSVKAPLACDLHFAPIISSIFISPCVAFTLVHTSHHPCTRDFSSVRVIVITTAVMIPQAVSKRRGPLRNVWRITGVYTSPYHIQTPAKIRQRFAPYIHISMYNRP